MNAAGNDYSILDSPQVCQFLFHPRPESGFETSDKRYQELLIPVDDEVSIGARFYASQQGAPVLLFFHGNGEIVADYDDLGQFYQRMNINFMAVDYRGYGISGGTPTVSSMLKDSHQIYDYVVEYLKESRFTGALLVMGRSLGSASALELAASHSELIDGLIIESGFAFSLPLLRLLGIDLERIGVDTDPIANDQKIKQFSNPTLVIHAEFDHIIPFSDGQCLFQNAQDPQKELLKIPGANHNDILARGLEDYMKAVKKLVERAVKAKILREAR